MKNLTLKVLSCLLVITSLIPTTTLAVADRASDRIVQYYIITEPTNTGSFDILCNIFSNGVMERLGFFLVDVDQKIGNTWIDYEEYDINYDNMYALNTMRHSNAISIKGIAGRQYHITVTFFAEDESGTEYRETDTYITA